MSEVGNRIKILRKKRRYTQAQLAKATGISQSNISQYERFVEPPSSALAKIAEALNTTMDFLGGRTDNPEPPVTLSDRERRLLDLVRAHGGQVTFEDVANFWLDNMPELPEDE